MDPRVHYRIRPSHPEAHLFEVELTVSDPNPDGEVVSLPAWIPGSYMIRDFAKNIVRLRARCAEQPLEVEKMDKQTWRVAPCSGPLTVWCEVYCWDLSVRSAHLDTSHGYFNGTSVFLQVQGREGEPCSIAIEPPEASHYAQWRVATTLPAVETDDRGFGLYRAADYEELVDHPVEMGTFTLVEFEACGIPHAMAITGRHRADVDRLAADLKQICEYQIRLFGEPAPMDRYLFLTMAVGDGYGGLEHRSSTSLLCSRNDLPLVGRKELTDDYRGFLGLCSHEYFHTWNIKRIKPAAFVPYDLSREVHTRLLWAFEGITSYYDDLALVRTGVISEASYLELLGQTITRVLRTGGRLKQSVTDSSFDAWTKFYKQDENAPNAIVSYYAKGALIALALDLKLRLESGGAKSLDDVMRALWERYGRTGTGVGEQAFEPLVEEVTGVSLGEFFAVALQGTDDLPLAELLSPFGVDLRLRAPESKDDKGGKPGKGEQPAKAWLGVRTSEDPLGAKLTFVFDGGAAQRAGLSAGDVVVALNGLRVTSGNLEKQLSTYAPDERVTLHAFRRDELSTFEVALQPAPADTCFLKLQEEAAPEALARRKAWLNLTEAG